MKPLLISTTLPGIAQESSHGIFRRLDMFADAIKMASGSLGVLFYVQDGVDTGAENTARMKELLEARWKTEVDVTLASRQIHSDGGTFWGRYLRPALGFHEIPDYMVTSGKDQVGALESCLDRTPSYIFAHRLKSMAPLLLTKKSLPPVFFDMDDIEHVAFKRSIPMPPTWKSKRLLNLQIPAIISGEKRSIDLAKKTFVCSPSDKTFLEKYAKPEKIEVIPNAIRIPERPSLVHANRLMMLGQYGYPPNRIGIEYFLEKVWPRVHSAAPDVFLVVAGPGPESIRQYGNPPPGVEFTGFVEDLDALYHSIRVVVCPILSGGGTRVKLVEAAAFGKPIVSTRIGAEGLDFEDGVHALLRDDPAEMAEGCIALLKDERLAARLGDAARSLAIENYERDAVARKIADIFSAI